MGLVSLRFSASAAHVRTARLVAVTVARRAGLGEEQVEAVRQAVGEACALSVGRLGPDTQVTLTLDDAPPQDGAPAHARLVARVGPLDVVGGVGSVGDLGLAVLGELTDHYAFESGEPGGALRLTWLQHPSAAPPALI